MMNQALMANSAVAGAPMQSDVGKITAQFDAAEQLYHYVMDIARHLVGEHPVDGSSISGQKSGGTLGDLAYRAEYLTEFAAKAHAEIERIYRATSL